MIPAARSGYLGEKKTSLLLETYDVVEHSKKDDFLKKKIFIS